ncbi:hypothetical protein [Natrinema gelatinilyticum]|uniref:hypothetical protein n=1 Tax=Natrinema gelatinilyticum TaxID=2961571 RepID=UPI0020C50F1E|nr:hypothetical protein [Natrinema gelatinilyticum]
MDEPQTSDSNPRPSNGISLGVLARAVRAHRTWSVAPFAGSSSHRRAVGATSFDQR